MAKQLTLTLDTKLMDKIIASVGSEGITPRTIHDGVEYGIYQEFSQAPGGNPQTNRKGRMGLTGPGHPSLIPAWERVTKDLPDAIGQAIERGQSVDDVLRKAAFDIQRLWAEDVNVDTTAYRDSIKVSDG